MGSVIQRWRATLDDVRQPDRLLRLLNEMQSQVANAFAILPARTVREFTFTPPSRWVDATLVNSWVGDPSFATPGFWRDDEGVVYLRGNVSGGTYGTTIFTLPAGFRPTAFRAFAVAQGCALYEPVGTLNITSAGVVSAPVVTSVQSGVSSYLSLDGVSFEGADAGPVVNTGAPIVLSGLGFAHQASGVRVIACTDMSRGSPAPLPAIAWTPTGRDGIQVTQVFGLSPGHRYTVRLEITG